MNLLLSYFLNCLHQREHDSRITYNPRKVGVYIIRVLDQENCTAGDPISVDVFDPGMIKVSKLGDITLGEFLHLPQRVSFSILRLA